MKWSYQAYGIKFVPLRYFNVAGAKPDGSIGEDHGPETHLLPIILQVAQGVREKIMIFGDDYKTPDGTNVRDYVHPFDLASAHLLALDYLPDLHRFHLLQLNLGIQLRRVRRLNPPLHRQVKSGIVAARDQGKDYNQQHYFLCFC